MLCSSPSRSISDRKNRVVSQYGLPLEFGFVDPETGLQEFVDKMKAAGYDDVLAAYQAQAKEYANS